MLFFSALQSQATGSKGLISKPISISRRQPSYQQIKFCKSQNLFLKVSFFRQYKPYNMPRDDSPAPEEEEEEEYSVEKVN
jgi:hypothetical protein